MTLGEETFERVLDAAGAGSEWAWAEIYRELAPPVRGYLAGRGAVDPDGLTGDVFFKVARAVHTFEGDLRSFRSWVFVIAHRLLIDERRSRGRRPEFTELPADLQAGDVEMEAMERLTTAEVKRAFEQLTDAQRDVLSLRIIAGLTLSETAQVLGKNVGAVKVMQHRALRALEKNLELEDVTR